MNKLKALFDKNPVYLFALKGIGIYIVWYFFYDLWILPAGNVDEALSLNIIDVAAGILHAIGYSEVYTAFRIIGIGESPGIEIVNGCNGLSAIGLFIGFVVAYPGDNVKRILFLITGIGVIYLVNVIRVVILAVTQVYWADFFDFTHDYSTTAIFYIVIFIMWVIWANYGGSEQQSETVKPIHA
ncbi:exosortase/archaeosortase family protein [bacterium]|nr:MAG: exosortase/archaeosortase family protein [bacterium]